MFHPVRKFQLLRLLMALLSMAARGQNVAPDSSVSESLLSLSERAGVVFAGEVSSVRQVGDVVEVQFRVDQALKGAPGGSQVLREWAGLWAAGQRRYWVGERAVFFLHPPGSSGFSSSVDGMEGVLPVLQDATVDVGRLRSRVRRDAGAPMAESTAGTSLTDIATVLKSAPGSGTGPGQGPLPPRVPVRPPRVEPVTKPQRPLPPEVTGPAQNSGLELEKQRPQRPAPIRLSTHPSGQSDAD